MDKKSIGLLLGALAIMGCTTGGPARFDFYPPIDGVYFFTVGEFRVSMLVEAEREGNTGILIDADEELLARYIPETGFRHTANAFLISTPERNILVDAGTGVDGIIIDKIRALGLEPDQIDTILITHLHRDHFGGLLGDNGANFPNAQVFLAAQELEYFTRTNVNEGAVAALAPYQVTTFNPRQPGSVNTALFPGITPMANFGHTPGHTVFLIEDSNDKLLIAGDFLHVALVQFAHPEISATFDVDPHAAAVSRRQILEFAEQNNIPIGGMHIVYPGVGTVEAADDGFTFTPRN